RLAPAATRNARRPGRQSAVTGDVPRRSYGLSYGERWGVERPAQGPAAHAGMASIAAEAAIAVGDRLVAAARVDGGQAPHADAVLAFGLQDRADHPRVAARRDPVAGRQRAARRGVLGLRGRLSEHRGGWRWRG